MRRNLLLVAATGTLACGGPGDNSAVRAFHPSVKVGMPLVEAIAAGEKAQAYDIHYSVAARECPGDTLVVSRDSDPPSIRVVHPDSKVDTPWGELGGYTEVGYATREDFLAGLRNEIPKFTPCKVFRFTFGRYQGWPRSDSFTVTVNPDGRIATVSPLTEDPVD